VSLGLQALDTALATRDDATAATLLSRVRAEAGIAVGEVRRILDDLRPAALDEVGLAAAVARHARAVGSGVLIEFDVASAMPPLPTQVEIAAYRIAQESLTNVTRHAGASHACLTLAVDQGVLRLQVADDGHGFEPGPQQGVGLQSMRHRAETLGGSLEVTTGNHGTTVVATLPLDGRP